MEFRNTEVFNIEGALRSMRNPKNSWHKSDSEYEYDQHKDDWLYVIGENDLDLAQRLVRAGTEHSKFMRSIFVSVDIVCPTYIAAELDTYKVGTTANSESTMHTITKRALTYDDFEMPEDFATKHPSQYNTFLDYISFLNGLINGYNLPIELPQDKEYKEDMFKILKSCLPESFMQKRTVCLSYATLANIYKQRKNHRLSQWNTDFVNWVKTLPYSEFITGEFSQDLTQ